MVGLMSQAEPASKRSESGEWRIKCDRATFDRLKTQQKFWQIVTLSRSINALRFVHSPLDSSAKDDSHLGTRTRINSFLQHCAILYEAINLVRKMEPNFGSHPAYAALQKLRTDALDVNLTKTQLYIVRHKVAFHFDATEFGEVITNAPSEEQTFIVVGSAGTNGQTYYELADLYAMEIFVGLPSSDKAFWSTCEQAMKDTTQFGLRFLEAADELIATMLSEWGFYKDHVGV
jgi:hypothetical protein